MLGGLGGGSVAYYNNCVFESDMVNKTEWLVDYRFCHPSIWRLQVPVLYMFVMLLHVNFTNMCHVVIKLICYILLAMLQAVLCIKVVKTSSRPYYFFKVLLWSWSYGSWIYNYLCDQCLSPLTLWIRIPLRRSVLDTTLCDKVCHWLASGRWFSPGTLVSNTNKTDRYITEILLKVALNTLTFIIS